MMSNINVMKWVMFMFGKDIKWKWGKDGNFSENGKVFIIIGMIYFILCFVYFYL